MKAIVNNSCCQIFAREKLTRGTVGKTMEAEFSADWDELAITAVFEAGDEKKDVVYTGEPIIIPHEVLATASVSVMLGFHGALPDGTIVKRTEKEWINNVSETLDPAGVPSSEPTPDWTAQVQAIATEAKEVADSVRSDADAGKFTGPAGTDGGWYTPAVTQPDENTMRVAFTPSKEGMPAVDPTDITIPTSRGSGEDGGYYTPEVTQTSENTMQVAFSPSKASMPAVSGTEITLPDGQKGDKGDTGATGADGKSAYAYAVEGGYTGTEAEFAEKLAAEIPDVDATLSQSGHAADAKAVSDAINSLSEEMLTEESDPTVPAWAKEPTKPVYTASEVGADPSGTAASKVAAHNTGADTHSDIRLLIQGLTDRLNALADSDDTTLDQLSEVVAYIKSNRSLIEAITTSKVSVADIVDNLTTNVSSKPLSAAQGVVIKTLIDALRNSTYSKPSSGIPKTDLASDVQDSLTKVDNMAANVKDYGAIGDGVADDTVAFQNALASNRCVYVSGGTYKLSGALVIRDACSMELSTDAVLDFTMTSGKCIAMKMSAYLRGNHAVIRVPYEFNGDVIYVASSLDDSVVDVPPYTKWDPQWKTGRYITDVCIVKPDSRGFHYSVDGACSGTAVYIEADSGATSTFIWGLNASGLRIAGAFSYGIHAKMIGTGWCHEARIEALIDACEIGVCMEDCNNAYVAATIQPRPALTTAGANVAYAKYGIYLIRSRNTDLSGSRVWDWKSNNSLWTGDTDSGCIYQHIAMIGNCAGTILNDFLYYEMPSYDIRKIIYTDTASNLEKINILQEPFTRWFKPISGAPIFYTGAENKELLLKETYDATFQTTLVPQFTNLLPQAIDISGAAFGTNGYKVGKMWGTDGVTLYDGSGILCSGLIPCSGGSVVRMKGISFSSGNDDCRVILYKADKTKLMHVNRNNLITNGASYFINNYSAGENGCQFQIVENSAAYFAFNVYLSTSDGNPTVTVDEELNYSQVGTLASGIKVDYGQLINAPAVGVTQAWVESQRYLTLADLPKYDGGVS